MSLAKDNIWKLLAPLVVMGVMFLIPVPDGMPPQAWHYFAVFVAIKLIAVAGIGSRIMPTIIA
ncbi:anion permease, partial [Escherichia sp. TWPC-MK]